MSLCAISMVSLYFWVANRACKTFITTRAAPGRPGSIALGVIEKYRRVGIAEMLVLRIVEDGMIKRGFTGELSLTLEDNFTINRFLEAIGAHRYKTYRIYRKQLPC